MQLNVKETAELFNVSEKTIYRWIDKEIIPVYKINNSYRFDRLELLEWANSQKKKIAPEVLSKIPEVKLYTIKETLEIGNIFYRVNGKTKKTVLKSAVNLIKLPDTVDRKFLYHSLLSRENLSSTGIGNGIAIPHIRNPFLLDIDKPSINICFLENSVNFNAIDEKPVNILFLLLSNHIRVHLNLLSRLSYILQNKKVIKTLKEETVRKKMLDTIYEVEKKEL